MTAVDTSVVVAAVTSDDRRVRQRCREAVERSPAPIAHVLVESFSVLTRLPGPLRLSPAAARRLLADAFTEIPMALSSEGHRRVIDLLGDAAVGGGAVYDAVIGRTAREHGEVLLTRDRRAAATYLLVEAQFALV